MNFDFENKIETLLKGLPVEIANAVREKITFFKSKACISQEECYREARQLVRLEMLAYMDRREYFNIYNRRWSEHKLAQYIREVVAKKSHDEKDLFTLARANLDVNGLKALNDLGGHEAGNKGLKLFANILNFGHTTLWLRDELGLTVTTSAEGGDEFGLVIYGDKDLREYALEIKKRYGEEIWNTEAGYLLDFKRPEIREKLSMLGIADEVPNDFKFRLSASVGLCLFGEAIISVDVTRPEASFHEVTKEIVNKLFQLSDERSMQDKSIFKKSLAQIDPILSGLYSRMSREVIHLERELRTCHNRIKELEGKLK